MPWSDQLDNLDKWAKWVDTGVVKNNGITVVLYRQANDVRTKVGGGDVEGGWCLAMSVYWIIKTARGGSFWDWFQPPAQACPNLKNPKQGAGCGEIFMVVRDMMRGEGKKTEAGKLLGSAITPEIVMKMSSWWAPKVLHDSGCLRLASADGYKLQAVEGNSVCDLLLKAPGYKCLGISGKKGNHAMTARVVDGTVVFMDPNYGEFYFPSFTDFRGFMTGFWKKVYGPGMSDFIQVLAFTDPEVIKYG